MTENRYFAVSFMATHFSRLKTHWEKYNKLREKGVLGTDKALPPFLGGKITILDWTKKKIVWDIDIDIPTGMCFVEGILFANSLKNEIVGISKDKKFQYKITSPKFNSLHSLVRTASGFLVTSSGLDLVLEVDDFGNSIYEWWATDHGFATDPSGRKRVLPKERDYRKEIHPTASQTTHINSAIPYDKDYILATLFHQGMLIKINRGLGEYVVLLDGLAQPHSIYEIPHGFLISDTSNNRALVLDKNLQPITELTGNFNWVQDAILTPNGSFLVADANNNRLVEISIRNNKLEVMSVYEFDKEWRVFQVVEMPQRWITNF